jgi:hypothetical protein
MELPREIQVYILSYLYDPWRKRWKQVMKTLKQVEMVSHHFQLSRLMLKTCTMPGQIIQYRVCLDCGNYYHLPLYSCSTVGCDCP